MRSPKFTPLAQWQKSILQPVHIETPFICLCERNAYPGVCTRVNHTHHFVGMNEAVEAII